MDRGSQRLAAKRKLAEMTEDKEVAETLIGPLGVPRFDTKEKRRDPPYPNGFQPTSIRDLITVGLPEIGTPSDTFPGVTIDQQLEELSNVESRELIEVRFRASEQCKALGIVDTDCFLCGFSLKHPNIPFASETDFGYPQCEHLLPSAAAILVFGIVESTKTGKASPELYRENYHYAHRGCNLEKSSRLFLVIDHKKYVGDEAPILDENIKRYLNDLYTFNPIIKVLVRNKEDWIRTQTDSIKKTYTPLSKELGRLTGLSSLQGVARYFTNIDILYAREKGLVKGRTDYEKRRRLGGRKTFRRKRNGKSVRRTTAKSHVTASRTH